MVFLLVAIMILLVLAGELVLHKESKRKNFPLKVLKKERS